MADSPAMKPVAFIMVLIESLLAIVLITATARGQIFADFTVSQGGAPLGTFRARLDHDKAPRTCANFIGLATGRRSWVKVTSGQLEVNKPYYNGLTFHRLIHNFVIQGGSPNGQGTDGPGFVIQDEFHASLRHSGRYMLSMAKSTLPNTGGSQFFITLEATTHLDDKHSVFGEVIGGKEIIDGFTSATHFPTNTNQGPLIPVVMESVVISGPDLAGFDIDNPALMLPVASGIRLTPSRNAAANSFTVTFDRRARHDYHYSTSLDLLTWSPFRQILSLNDENQSSFTITGLNLKRFFSRMTDVDYSLLPNPPGPLLPANASVAWTDRAGNSITLVSNGAGGGTWSDSLGASGNIVSLSIYDGAGNSNTMVGTSSNAHLIPLSQIVTTLDANAGLNSRRSFNLVLSFHTPTSGWCDGTASGGPNPGSTTILQAFTYMP
jgi:peptidyl-prolyl cis-trans isomerase A (cyclophilin A)